MSKLGFIGLGIMGAPMAAHLIGAGHDVFLYTRSQVPAELLTRQASACASAQEVAQKADIIFLMLPDTPDVAKVLFSDDGVASGLSQGKTVVDMRPGLSHRSAPERLESGAGGRSHAGRGAAANRWRSAADAGLRCQRHAGPGPFRAGAQPGNHGEPHRRLNMAFESGTWRGVGLLLWRL